MGNIYFYAYYLTLKLSMRLFPNNHTPKRSALYYFSLPFCFTITAILTRFGGHKLYNVYTEPWIEIATWLVSVTVNYYLVYVKANEITEYYDLKFSHKRQNKMKICLVVVYYVLSFYIIIRVGLSERLSNLKRINSHVSVVGKLLHPRSVSPPTCSKIDLLY